MADQKSTNEQAKPLDEATHTEAQPERRVHDPRQDTPRTAQDVVGERHGKEASDDARLVGDGAESATNATYQPNPQADPGTPPRIIGDRNTAGSQTTR
jgi:hypothetical protein